MATTEEVKKLAALARITVEDAELETFTREFDAILTYVSQLEKLDFMIKQRRKIAGWYNKILAPYGDLIQAPATAANQAFHGEKRYPTPTRKWGTNTK